MTFNYNTLTAVLVILCLLVSGCEEANEGTAMQAWADVVRAADLADQDIENLAVEIARQWDLKHSVALADNPYALRLQRLVGDIDGYDGQAFDCKVYLSTTVNALAMANGTIRIYSGLMDMLDDRELLFVVGHEMGHVVKKHVKRKISMAYLSSAVRKAMASQQKEAGEIASSALGAFAEQLLNAQFSQQEEREADDYGVLFLLERGHDRQPAISTLTKLAGLGADHNFLSSHPAPEARAERLGKSGYDPHTVSESTVPQRLWAWLKGYWPL